MTTEDIKYAYRKLKHTIYYDSTYSFLRSDLASFEQDNNDMSSLDRLTPIFEEMNIAINKGVKDDDKTYFVDLIADIDYWRLPKTFDNFTIGNGDSNILTNVPREEETIKVLRDFKLIKSDIKLHLFSVLWILKGGFYLENDMKVEPYGNKLEIKSDKKGVVKGLRLFKPYHKLYKDWRDNAFKKAKQLISEKENVLLISLDVKNYYPSVKLNFQLIEDFFRKQIKNEEELKEMLFLNNILKDIHEEYATKNQKEVNEKVITGLPIGLHSSSILGNWFLRKLDDNIRNTINPAYYARYVDDIMLVISNPYIEKYANLKKDNKTLKDWIFKRYFIETGIFEDPNKNEEINENNKNEKIYKIVESLLSRSIIGTTNKNKDKIYVILFDKESSGLEIQSEKSRFYYFDKDQPTALLDKIEKEIKIESSEFRYLPDEKDSFKDFYSESHYLTFDGSVNKLRNVAGFGVNLFGASKDLSKKILSVLQIERKPDKESARQLNIFFQGTRAIETFKLWEKTATYFIVTKDAKGLQKFVKNIIHSIEKVEFIENFDTKIKETDRHHDTKETIELRKSLSQSLAGSISMALALDTDFLNKDKDTERVLDKVINQVEAQIQKFEK